MIKFVAMPIELYEYLLVLINGFDYPGLQFADPATAALIAAAAASAVQAGSNIIGARKRKKEGEEMMRLGEAAADEYSKELLELGKRAETVDQGFYDLQANIKAMNEARRKQIQDQANRAEATILRNVSNPRAAANVNEMLFNVGQGTDQALAGVRESDIASDKFLLGQEQAIADRNFNRLFNMESMLLGDQYQRAAQSAEAGRAMKYGAQDMYGQTGADFLNTLGNIAALSNTPTGEPPKTADQLGLKMVENGGVVRAKAGAAIMTPGEYSHETNPQDLRADEGKMILDNKEGDAIAEFTGKEIVITDEGENEGLYVVAPKDAVSLKEMTEKGDKEGVFKYWKNLLKRFEEEQAEHESMKKEMEQENV